MHSPGQSSAAWITFLEKRCSTPTRLPGSPGIVARQRRFGTRRRCRPRAGRRRRGSDRRTVRRPCTGPGRSTPASVQGRYRRATACETNGRLPCQPVARTASRTPPTVTAAQSTTVGLAARPRRPGHASPTSRPRTPTPTPGSRRSPTCRRQIFDEIKSRIQETDLSVAGPLRRLVVLHPHGRGARATRSSCRGRTRRRAAGQPDQPLLDENVRADGPRVLRGRARSTSARATTARVVSRPRRRRALHAAHPRPRHRRRPARRIADATYVRLGLVGRRRVPLLRRARRGDAPVPRCGATALGTSQADDVLVYSRARRAVQSQSRQHPKRQVASSSRPRAASRARCA